MKRKTTRINFELFALAGLMLLVGAADWAIESNQTLEVESNRDLRANEYLVEQRGKRQLVHFWYRSHRRTGILGGFDQNVDRMLEFLLDRRADGPLDRIGTPITEDDTASSRGRLRAFARLPDPLLGEHWPTDFACDEARPGQRCIEGGLQG